MFHNSVLIAQRNAAEGHRGGHARCVGYRPHVDGPNAEAELEVAHAAVREGIVGASRGVGCQKPRVTGILNSVNRVVVSVRKIHPVVIGGMLLFPEYYCKIGRASCRER